ncbi:hypothetical protein GBA52_009293 [Prunus armeniaca]|nr:hypothetical protein GBA52_009293 [Prunus armeniaca]
MAYIITFIGSVMNDTKLKQPWEPREPIDLSTQENYMIGLFSKYRDMLDLAETKEQINGKYSTQNPESNSSISNHIEKLHPVQSYEGQRVRVSISPGANSEFAIRATAL